MTKVSLVFDDGFAQSSLRTAEIFEARKLMASFAVLVDSSEIYPDTPKGDFALWNNLQERGHIVQPHGYDHSDLTKISLEDAKYKIDACLDYFSVHLKDFDAEKTIYHLTYNRSTALVNDYLLGKVKAIRAVGPEGKPGSGMNNQAELAQGIYNCSWYGPKHCDEHLMASLQLAEVVRPKVFMYMLHGLDNEGWGPLRSHTLERALDYILESPFLDYIDTSAL